MSWLEESFLVLAYSTKTQLAIIAGFIFFFGSLAAGHYYASTIIFHGTLAAFSEPIRMIIIERYEHVAWGSLFSFSLLAYKCYKKDKKCIFNL